MSKELARIKRIVKKELTEISKNLIVLIDTREKKESINRITIGFEKKGIKTEIRKLDTGDYSFKYKTEDYSSLFSIDRKQDINEFVGNLKEDRFKNELERAKTMNYFSLCIEKGDLSKIYKGKYISEMKKESSIALIETIKNRFQIDFIEGIDFSEYLYYKIHYWIRSYLIQKYML